jgi:hypothetical protein
LRHPKLFLEHHVSPARTERHPDRIRQFIDSSLNLASRTHVKRDILRLGANHRDAAAAATASTLLRRQRRRLRASSIINHHRQSASSLAHYSSPPRSTPFAPVAPFARRRVDGFAPQPSDGGEAPLARASSRAHARASSRVAVTAPSRDPTRENFLIQTPRRARVARVASPRRRRRRARCRTTLEESSEARRHRRAASRITVARRRSRASTMGAIFTRTVSDREVRDIILCARERARTRLGMRLRARLRGENLKNSAPLRT